jgi:sulfur-oxidizing protein SoxA
MARGGILATSAAIIVALAGGVFVAAESGVHAQATKKEAPLELKEDASARPWKRYAGWPTRDYSKYNTIGNLATPPAPKEPRKITGPITGDAKKGAEMVADRNRGGSCLACHVMGPAGGANLPARQCRS